MLITHDGKFHPDDVLAYVILKLFFVFVTLVRTRTTDNYINENAIVFDVGGDKYDHHKIDKEYRPNGIPFSSCGLVWRDFGRDIIKNIENSLSETEIDEIFYSIDKQLIEGIDAVDNGIYQNVKKKYNQYSLSTVISSFNDGTGSDESFYSAANVSEVIFMNLIKNQIKSVLDRKQVLVAVEEQKDSPILVLEDNIMWKKHVNNIPHVMYVITPSINRDKYKVRAVQNSKSLTPRKPLPKSWAGLNDVDLQKKTTVKDALFCHPNRFLAGAKTKDGAIKLAQVALMQ